MTTPRTSNRRAFLQDVGRGTLTAALGAGLVADLGLVHAQAFDDPAPGSNRLTFGALEPLVALLQETAPEALVDTVLGRLAKGEDLRRLVGAAALANARAFGGEDYVGYHTLMALAPAYAMAQELPEGRRPLPVLKVLYRNASRLKESGKGQPSNETLRALDGDCCALDDRPGGELLRDAVRSKDLASAEDTFAALACGPPNEALDALLYAVQDNTEVHRVVLPYRAWDLLGLIGPEQAHTLLRQSVRYCVVSERDWRHDAETDRPRVVLPKLLDQFGLADRPRGERVADDAWVEHLSRAIFEGSPDSAAEAAAEALAEGFRPDDIGEAIALAANQLVLRDVGRPSDEATPAKPAGSVHGDSIGVHACDSANAWRNLARVGNARNRAACLILGAYQVARDRTGRGGDFLNWPPRPLADDLVAIAESRPDALVSELESAIKGNDQARAAALVQRYGEVGAPPRPVFDALLRFAVTEDGALHAEKYYHTVSEEFATSRPAFRWRQLVALARVTASEFGQPAPGVEEASRKLALS